MRSKIYNLKPKQSYLSEDFAVLEFETYTECTNALKGFRDVNHFYEYHFEAKDCRFVIINDEITKDKKA